MTELLGFITGAVCVYLTLRESVWNFPVGLANNFCFLVLFLHGRLFGDAGLQVLYIMLGIQGWHQWLYGGPNRTALKVTRASPQLLSLVTGLTILTTAIFILMLRTLRDAAPILDAVTTSVSLSAQYLVNRKIIENWILWLLADLIYIYLYLSRGFQLTAVLYAGFSCLCVAGILAWLRSMQRGEAAVLE